jgi:CRISPR-associated protein Cas2
MVMFDLPVGLKQERKMATNFRNSLLDMGFEMDQFSVYTRFVGNRERCKKYIEKIKLLSPQAGKITILFFTDKQFAQSIKIIGGQDFDTSRKPEQLSLF